MIQNIGRRLRRALGAIGRRLDRRATQAYFKGARASQHHVRRGMAESPDGATRGSIEKLRNEARHLEQNYDLVSGALDVFVDNVVGLGLRPRPMVRSVDGTLHEELNSRLTRLFADWAKRPEVTGEYSYNEVQRIMCRTWARDGEAFAQRLSGFVPGLDHQTIVPYSIELIEADLLPSSFHDPARGIVQSVQKNEWGRPRDYFLYKHHPGDGFFAGAGVRIGADPDKSISADRMTHLKLTTRIRQTRGISILACCLDRIDSLRDGEESELVAMRVAAAMTGFIKRGTAEDFDLKEDVSGKPKREFAMVPGAVYELDPGEDVGTIASNRPNNNLIAFLQDQLRRVASGLKVSYSSLAKNYDGTFSSQRQEMVEQRVSYGALSDHFGGRLVAIDHEHVVRNAIASGLVDIPPDVDESTLYEVAVDRPAMPWIDPKKEADAYKTLIELGVESRAHVISQRGRSPEEVFSEIEHERREHPMPTSASPATPPPTEPDDEGAEPPPRPSRRPRESARA